jgi:hypothetical protein
MTILPVYYSPEAAAQDAPAPMTEVPVQEPVGIERPMLAQDKIFVVLAVVLLIWFGLIALIYRTDRRVAALERRLDEQGVATDLT